MEIQIENIAAGSAISNPENPYPDKKLIRYQLALALMDSLRYDGDLSEQDHKTARALLACRFGFDSSSIFR